MNKRKLLFFIILLYFISQTLSICGAANITVFIAIYKNIVIGMVIFLIAYLTSWDRQYIKKVLLTLVVSTIINSAYQFVIYFKFPPLYGLLQTVIYNKYFDFVVLQAERPRFFIELCNEVMAPILLSYYYYFSKKGLISTLVLVGLLGASLFFSIASNYRIIFIVFIFCIVSSIWLYESKNINKFTIIFLCLALLIFTLQKITLQSQYSTSISRLTFEDAENTNTLSGRVAMWQQAFEMGKSSPLFGVGLGNYYDMSKKPSNRYGNSFDLSKVTLIHPHNVFVSAFSSTGLLGLLSLIILYSYFFMKDLIMYRENKIGLQHYLIISFWGLFISSLTGPRETVQFLALFWLLRGLIEADLKLVN